MNRLLVWIAAGWIIAANVLVMVHVWRNRLPPPEAVVELTEFDLRLEERDEDQSAVFLRPALPTARVPGAFRPDRSPAWLDAAKLQELGYRLDPAATQNPEESRLRFMPGKEAFIVLDSRPAETAGAGSSGQPVRPSLPAIDAGLAPAPLRAKYADTNRYILMRAVIRPWMVRRYDESRRVEEPGKLRAIIDMVAVPRIHVPHRFVGFFEAFGRQSSETYLFPREGTERRPRYAVKLAFGRYFEPSILAVRPLGEP
jgi:hypothetical protein